MQVNATGVDLLSRYDSIRARRVLSQAAKPEKPQETSPSQSKETKTSLDSTSSACSRLLGSYTGINVIISFDDLAKSFAQIDQNADGVVTQQEINTQSKAWQEESTQLRQKAAKIATDDWKLAQTNEEKTALSAKLCPLTKLRESLDDVNRAWKVIGEHSSTIASDQTGISLQDISTLASKFGKKDNLTELDFMASENPELYEDFMNKVQSGQISLSSMANAGVFDDLSHGERSQIRSFMYSDLAGPTQVTAAEARDYYPQLDTDQNGVLTDSELQQQLLSQPKQQQPFISQLLNNYQGVSALDGATGISRNDLDLLAGLHHTDYADGTKAQPVINGFDFTIASNPEIYQSYLYQKSQVYSIIAQSLGEQTAKSVLA